MIGVATVLAKAPSPTVTHTDGYYRFNKKFSHFWQNSLTSGKREGVGKEEADLARRPA
jgi:hypothetical protein